MRCFVGLAGAVVLSVQPFAKDGKKEDDVDGTE